MLDIAEAMDYKQREAELNLAMRRNADELFGEPRPDIERTCVLREERGRLNAELWALRKAHMRGEICSS